MFILFDITPDFENAFKFSSEERRILMQGKGVGKDVVVVVVDIFSIFYPVVVLKKKVLLSHIHHWQKPIFLILQRWLACFNGKYEQSRTLRYPKEYMEFCQSYD